MRHGYRILAVGLVTALILVLSACQQDIVGDKALIHQRLQQMVKSAENRKMSEFLEGIHADFLGQGSLRKANLAGLMLLHFRQHKSISVSLSEMEIQLEMPTATVRFTAQLYGQAGWLGHGRRLGIQSRWRKMDDEWQMERARWQVLN